MPGLEKSELDMQHLFIGIALFLTIITYGFLFFSLHFFNYFYPVVCGKEEYKTAPRGAGHPQLTWPKQLREKNINRRIKVIKAIPNIRLSYWIHFKLASKFSHDTKVTEVCTFAQFN